jgi:hypothetical protein
VIILALTISNIGCTGIFVRDLPLKDPPNYPEIEDERVKNMGDYVYVPKDVWDNIGIKMGQCIGYTHELRDTILTTHD